MLTVNRRHSIHKQFQRHAIARYVVPGGWKGMTKRAVSTDQHGGFWQ